MPFGTTSGGRRLDLEGQVSGLERDKVFNDATRQSGGLHLSSARTAGLWAALERIAAELRRQYVVSYDGDVESDGDGHDRGDPPRHHRARPDARRYGDDNARVEANGLPSRTSILTAAARALGSREPDASVRNPDWLADRLIGPAELALIADHPISRALDRDFQEP